MLDYEAWSSSKLIDRIYALEAEVEGLKSATKIDRVALLTESFGTTPLQSRLLAALSDGRVKPIAVLHDAVYFDAPEVRCERSVELHLNRVRRNLKCIGVKLDIFRHRGVGLQLMNPEVVSSVMNGKPSGINVVARTKFSDRPGAAISFMEKRADEHRHVRFASTDLMDAINLTGECHRFMRRLEDAKKLKVISRPTKSSRRNKWHVVLNEAVA